MDIAWWKIPEYEIYQIVNGIKNEAKRRRKKKKRFPSDGQTKDDDDDEVTVDKVRIFSLLMTKGKGEGETR